MLLNTLGLRTWNPIQSNYELTMIPLTCELSQVESGCKRERNRFDSIYILDVRRHKCFPVWRLRASYPNDKSLNHRPFPWMTVFSDPGWTVIFYRESLGENQAIYLFSALPRLNVAILVTPTAGVKFGFDLWVRFREFRSREFWELKEIIWNFKTLKKHELEKY